MQQYIPLVRLEDVLFIARTSVKISGVWSADDLCAGSGRPETLGSEDRVARPRTCVLELQDPLKEQWRHPSL